MSESADLHDYDDIPDQNIPGQAADGDGNQQPQEETLEDRGVDDLLDEGYSPPEKPSPLLDGRTEEEEREGQTLDERLEEEEPDFAEIAAAQDERSFEEREYEGGEVGTERAGRLTAESAYGEAPVDDLSAEDVGIDGGAAGAEEAAVHVIDEP